MSSLQEASMSMLNKVDEVDKSQKFDDLQANVDSLQAARERINENQPWIQLQIQLRINKIQPLLVQE